MINFQNNNVERAIDWIFSHQDEMQVQPSPDFGDYGNVQIPRATAGTQTAGPSFRDGSEKYQLIAFISHMGTSTMCGHYVCHIYKEGQWIIYNDNKVAVSERPPKELAYLYLYKRV